jgi:hypothetical protein
MASAAVSVQARAKIRRRKFTLVVHDRGKELSAEQGNALLLDISARYDARRLQRRLERTMERHQHSPERRSVAIAMLAVEEQIVKAFWVLARSTSDPVPRAQCQHGIDYPIEREDKWSAAVASGGWLSETPPPGRPTAAEIDGIDVPLEWIQRLNPEEKAIVSAGARSKNGEVSRRVNWMKVRLQLPSFKDWTADRLGRVYKDGLRRIAVGLADVQR